MLKRQMETEAEDSSYLDKLRKDMEDEVWAKRDAQHNTEEAARQELLRQVLISRNNQIETKRSNKIQAREEDTAYMNQLKRDAEEALQKNFANRKNGGRSSSAHSPTCCVSRKRSESQRSKRSRPSFWSSSACSWPRSSTKSASNSSPATLRPPTTAERLHNGTSTHDSIGPRSIGRNHSTCQQIHLEMHDPR